MKIIYSVLFVSILFVGCQAPVDNSANEAFEKNSATVLAVLEGFQSESIDYDAYYAEDFVASPTAFGSPDSLSLSDFKSENENMWAILDIELLNDEVNLLPGVNTDTKQVDGSVRYYGMWKVTRTATDSTEAKSAEFAGYESFDFNEEGKITYQVFYGDISGVMGYLMDDHDDEHDHDHEEETAEAE